MLELSPRSKPSQSLLKLHGAGYSKIKDLLWILPLRIQNIPQASPFSQMREGELFLGQGKILSAKFTPVFGRKGKGKARLFNATIIAQDLASSEIIDLKFFNTYPSFRTSIESKESFAFLGEPKPFRGSLQIVNPKIDPKLDSSESNTLIEYPTVAGVSGAQTASIISRIPETLWFESALDLAHGIKIPLFHKSPLAAFAALHGKTESSKQERDLALKDLVYCEFFESQLKAKARRKSVKIMRAPAISCSEKEVKSLQSKLPYQLTADQQKTLDEILLDMRSGSPMMRIAQGDVGCGKTTVAFLAAQITAMNGRQCALMCPTESLALQHYQTFRALSDNSSRVSLLLGGQSPAEKREVLSDLEQGRSDIVIGTHSLIQDAVKFKNLGLAIIDEQHKFGVEQRQKLTRKGEGAHTLIMSATPIPRTLQLAQYGDLDISTIRTMPSGRAGSKSRIVEPKNYEKYLSFTKTRLSLGEQVYIVVPSIDESEAMDIKNVSEIELRYRKIFPEYNVHSLHGRMKPEQKQEIFEAFSKGNIQILISTSVVEVGMNVLNATVMAVYNPERFGLSSLHQLRGRVGRGAKPGFFFLIPNEQISRDSMSRLKIIERTNDGFEIAEADLKTRGEGDLFGVEQSGAGKVGRIGNLFEHFDVFDQVTKDFPIIAREQECAVEKALQKLILDQKVSSTI